MRILLSTCILLSVGIWLNGWLRTVILVVMTGLNVGMWFFAPPGMVIGYRNIAPADSAPMLAGQGRRNLGRSILILLVLGVLPALGIGALLRWLLV